MASKYRSLSLDISSLAYKLCRLSLIREIYLYSQKFYQSKEAKKTLFGRIQMKYTLLSLHNLRAFFLATKETRERERVGVRVEDRKRRVWERGIHRAPSSVVPADRSPAPRRTGDFALPAVIVPSPLKGRSV